jgi:hypothetical protein
MDEQTSPAPEPAITAPDPVAEVMPGAKQSPLESPAPEAQTVGSEPLGCTHQNERRRQHCTKLHSGSDTTNSYMKTGCGVG